MDRKNKQVLLFPSENTKHKKILGNLQKKKTPVIYGQNVNDFYDIFFLKNSNNRKFLF